MSTPEGRHLNERLPKSPRPGIESSKAASQRAQQHGLIDTSEWARGVYDAHGMRLVLALQGGPHDHAGAQVANGRHLVAAANDSGEALFLLNSLTKGRRVHMGLGLWCHDAFLIGPSRRVQRWNGYGKVLDGLVAQLTDLRAVKEALAAWNTPPDLAMATVAAKDGYLESDAVRPSPKAFIDGFDGTMLDLSFEIVRRMRKGDYPSIEGGGRKATPITRPDGLFHAGIICFDTALTLAKDAGLVAEEIDFGDIRARRVRA
jgi:hypothetical protein